MERVFVRILQMTLAGGIVILGVLLLRLVLRRAPGRFRYLLWIVPAFRLCVPLSLPSPVSLFRLLRSGPLGGEDYTPAALTLPLENAVQTVGAGPGTSAAGTAAATAAEVSAFPWLRLLAWVWLAAAAALLLYSLISTLLLRRRLATAVRLEGRIYQASGVDTPFLLGLIRPRIYIPWGMEGKDLNYALTHERCHLRRGDQWWRLLAWLILCVHWYNPLCWLAFFLMGRDMELSCDEAVLEHMGDVRGEYSESLLRIAGKRRLSSPGPLAFGETGVSSRVRNVLRWRHARRWVTVTAMLLCVLFTVAWVTDPASLGAETLTLNPDGTVGNLQWGMTPEEILAADGRFEIREDKYGYVWMGLEGANVLGHTGDIRLDFAPFIIDEELHRSKRGTPMLNQIVIDYPGEIPVREELTVLLGEPVKHALDYYREPEIVDGIFRAPFKSAELPEEEWYWLSDETALDLIPLEHMRIGFPKETDAWLQAGFCSVFVYQITVNEWETEAGTVTSLAILGNAGAYQRFLEDEYTRRTEEG